MKKILLLLLLLIPINVFAIELPDLYSEKAMIYDLTEDKVLLSKKADEVSSIASLTKMMTVLVGLETIENLDEKITITSSMIYDVPWDASIARLQVGTTVTYEDLLYAVMLPSGADAAYAIAKTSSGSLNNYVELMNKKAEELGMKNTHYKNVTGLDADGHKSTINDTLILLKYALQNDQFKKIYTSKEYTMSNNQKLEATVHSMGERLERDTSRIIGAKTGFTDDAGLCISAYFQSNGHELLLITLKAPAELKYAYHINDALNLIEFMDKNYNNQILIKKDEVVKNIKVLLSELDNYPIKASTDIFKYLPNDYDKSLIKIIYNGKEEIDFNTSKGNKIGTIAYYYEDTLLHEEDVVLNEKINVDVIKVLDRYKYVIVSLALVTIIGIGIIIIFRKKVK